MVLVLCNLGVLISLLDLGFPDCTVGRTASVRWRALRGRGGDVYVKPYKQVQGRRSGVLSLCLLSTQSLQAH